MILSLLVFLVLVGTALLTGNQGLRLLRCSFHNGEEEIIFSYALGLVVLSFLTLGLGVLGFLETKSLWAGVGVLMAAGVSRLPRLVQILTNRERQTRLDASSVWLEILFWLVIFVIGAGALAPLYDTDSLAYHLSTPQEFLRMKRIAWIPDDINSLFPFFTEMLFTLGLALRNETVAQLISWSFGVMLALSVISFFRRFFGSRKWGVVAALFLVLTPGIFNEMRQTLADLSWASFGFLSFYAMAVGLSTGKRGWLLLSFIFLGVVMGIKYLGALSVLAFSAAFLFMSISSGLKATSFLKTAATMFAVIFLAAGYWYFKNFQIHGNPFYPYFNQFFGLKSFMAASGSFAVEEYGHKVGMGKSLASLILLPFRLTFFPNRFDGWAEQIGPAYLAFLPFAFYGSRSRIRQATGLYLGVFFLGWFWLAQVTRFLYPALPFLGVLIVSGMSSYGEKNGKKCLGLYALLLTVFLINGAMLVFHSREAAAYLSGKESKEIFLSQRERSYAMAKFVNENLPADAKILNSEEVRMFYFNRLMVRESGYRVRTKYNKDPNPDVIINQLKEDGFSHLLLTKFGGKEPAGNIREWLKAGTEQGNIGSVHQTKFKERSGREVEYSLYRLK